MILKRVYNNQQLFNHCNLIIIHFLHVMFGVEGAGASNGGRWG